MKLRADGAVRAAGQPPGRARIVAGAALIAGAALVGITVGQSPPGAKGWVVQRPVAAEAAVRPDDVVLAEVAIPDPTVLWPAGSAPQGVAARPLVPGQPLMAGDVAPAAEPQRQAVALSLPPDRLPAQLQVGDQVDVWVGAQHVPRLALTQVAVSAVTSDPALPAPAQVEVLVSASQAEPAVTAALADDVVLVRR